MLRSGNENELGQAYERFVLLSFLDATSIDPDPGIALISCERTALKDLLVVRTVEIIGAHRHELLEGDLPGLPSVRQNSIKGDLTTEEFTEP